MTAVYLQTQLDQMEWQIRRLTERMDTLRAAASAVLEVYDRMGKQGSLGGSLYEGVDDLDEAIAKLRASL